MRRVLIWLLLACMLGVVDCSGFANRQTIAAAAPRAIISNAPLAEVAKVPNAGRHPRILTVLTNSFGPDNPDFGAVLINETVGGFDPLKGTNAVVAPFSTNAVITVGSSTNWHFYVLTNATDFTNAVFLTFLARPPAAVPAGSNPLARAEIDVDLYVSRNPAITNLDPAALARADLSLGRGGSEMVLYSNATNGVYYVGVKCESPLGAQYNLAVDFSAEPFFQTDAMGNESLRGFPAPNPTATSNAFLLHITPDAFPVRRVTVTNVLTASKVDDLQLSLTHLNSSVLLENHSGSGTRTNATFVFDDTGEHDVPAAQPSDGPGTLQQFGGQNARGQWLLSLVTTNHPATNVASWIYLERQQDLAGGMGATILPGACRHDFLTVPIGGASLELAPAINSGTGPVSIQIYPSLNFVSSNCPVLLVSTSTPPLGMTVDQTSQPPLRPGQYTVVSCNLGPDPVDLNWNGSLTLSPAPVTTNLFTSTNLMAAQGLAISTSTLTVTNSGPVVSIEVGVRLDHPRVSDLVLSLISPDGHRVLLDANRGGTSSNGLGANVVVTNTTPVDFFGGPEAVTNVFDTGQSSGSILINYDFFALPDEMRVFYESKLLYDSGLVSFSGATNLHYGPGTSTVFSVIMNPDGNPQTNTAWHYSVTTTALKPQFFTFTENTNLTLTPLKFAPAPFTNLTFAPDGSPQAGTYYLPEEPLTPFLGGEAAGTWTLEIWNRNTGATSPPPTLLNWTLALVQANVVAAPVNLINNSPTSNLLGPGQFQWYAVRVPDWVSFATNSLLFSSAPVNLFFNETSPPTGTNAGDLVLRLAATNGTWSIRTNGSPPLIPGSTYYVAAQNTNAATVTVSMEVAFDVPSMVTLTSGFSFLNTNSGPLGSSDYYRFVASTNAVLLQFEVDSPTADVTLVARKGPPPPSVLSYGYISANPGTNDELIVLRDFSQTVSLNAGEWFLTVANATGQPATYSIMATEFTVTDTNLAVVGPVVSSNSACLSWSSIPGVHYFVSGKVSLSDSNWIPLSATIDATDFTTSFCLPLPTAYGYFRVSEGLVLVPSPPIVTSVTQVSMGTLLEWSGPTNSHFLVQWSPSLAPPNWHGFPGTPTSTNGTFLFLDPLGQPGTASPRFYRLEQEP